MEPQASESISQMPMYRQAAGVDTESVAERKPWKYHGYSELAKWMSLDADFFVLRRFSALNARLILDREVRIAELERQLAELDNPEKQGFDIHNGTVLGDENQYRAQLLDRLWTLMKDYNEFVIAHSQLRAQPYASKLETKNLSTWLENHENAIDLKEAGFISKKEDLICIKHEPKHLLRRLLERWGKLLSSRFLKDKERTGDVEAIREKQTHLFDGQKLDRVAYFLVVTIGLIMLISPIWGLYLADTQEKQLFIITGCIVAFTGLVGAVTVAKPFETLAATAAYAAVLMVFIQNSQQIGKP